MAVQAPPELQTPEVILRAMGSVMAGDTRSPAQKLLDFVLGGNPADRMAGVAPMRIGVMPGRERIASDIIKRGLKEPWFHGTQFPESLLRPLSQVRPDKLEYMRTFNPAQVGSTHGLRLGEPAGVSLTRSPEVARKFGDVLRVGVDIPPSSVGQFVDPEMQRLLRASYEHAGSLRANPVPNWGTTQVPAGITLKEAVNVLPQERNLAQFNQAMSDYLRSHGVEGIAYNPRRWAEYEMRVLDPNKAVPLGPVPMPGGPGGNLLQRYMLGRDIATKGYSTSVSPYKGLQEQLERQFQAAPTFPIRLRDVLGVTGAD